MTQFTDRFKDHSVHAEIKSLDESIASATFELSDGATRDGYDRFLRVFEYAKRRLAQADPELVSAQALASLQKQVADLRSHHETFKQNQDANTLNNQADALLNLACPQFLYHCL